jgi:hypothetical protein
MNRADSIVRAEVLLQGSAAARCKSPVSTQLPARNHVPRHCKVIMQAGLACSADNPHQRLHRHRASRRARPLRAHGLLQPRDKRFPTREALGRVAWSCLVCKRASGSAPAAVSVALAHERRSEQQQLSACADPHRPSPHTTAHIAHRPTYLRPQFMLDGVLKDAEVGGGGPYAAGPSGRPTGGRGSKSLASAPPARRSVTLPSARAAGPDAAAASPNALGRAVRERFSSLPRPGA